MLDLSVEIWRKIILGEEKSWVLFENNTVAILMQPETDLSAQAIKLMQSYGKVFVGSPAGDFTVIKLSEHEGWIVTCHHPDILTYVSVEEVGADANDLLIGITGRSKRDNDADQLKIIHVEDKRSNLI